MWLDKDRLDQFISLFFEWRYLLVVVCGILGWECYLLFAFSENILFTDKLDPNLGELLRATAHLILAFFFLFFLYKIFFGVRRIFSRSSKYLHDLRTLKFKALTEKDSLLLGYVDKLERRNKMAQSFNTLCFYLFGLILINGIAGWWKNVHTIIVDIWNYNRISSFALIFAMLVLFFLGIVDLVYPSETSDIPLNFKSDRYSSDENIIEKR